MEANNIGFSRLKRIFNSNINFSNYKKIVENAKYKIVGNIPDEFIKTIKVKSPENIGSEIQKIKNGFASSAKILRVYDKLFMENYKNATISRDVFKDAIKDELSENSENGKVFFCKIVNHFTTTKGINDPETLSKAAETLKENLSYILPKKAQIKVSYLGSGAFGNGFKIDFQDESGKKIFKTMVQKIYRKPILCLKKYIITAIINNLSSFSDDEIIKIIEEAKSSIGTKLPEKANKPATEILVDYKANLNKFKDKLKNITKNMNETVIKLHGVDAEANTTLKLKESVGHSLNKTNVINIDMFDLEEGYSIAPFADENLPKITSKIEFEKYGLMHSDIEHNKGNTLAGRIIDLGGVFAENKALLDKTVLKYYKKVINRENDNERLQLIERYKKLAENPKTPLRNKIIKGLEIAEEKLGVHQQT